MIAKKKAGKKENFVNIALYSWTKKVLYVYKKNNSAIKYAKKKKSLKKTKKI